MPQDHRPLRSVLYIPGSKERALEKARGLAADSIIFDLEDAVAPPEKAAARETLKAALAAGGYGQRTLLVRINALETEWALEDLDALAGMSFDAVLLPKVSGADAVTLLSEAMDQAGLDASIAIWAMIETPQGVLHAAEIGAHPRLAGFVLGTNDLAADLRIAGGDRVAMATALQMSVLAARATGVACIDGVYNAFKDEAGLAAECGEGRALGMDGKSLIHPAQIATANAVFAPPDDVIDLSRRQIEAFEAAGTGVAVLDGKIVENLHVAAARRILAQAEVIAAMEAQT
ncbi:MAG: CoA ester lyase [Pseudomonadota bacterium]